MLQVILQMRKFKVFNFSLFYSNSYRYTRAHFTFGDGHAGMTQGNIAIQSSNIWRA